MAQQTEVDKSNIQKVVLAQQHLLESLISVEEIKNAVWGCGREKAHGPGVFTFKLIKNKWESIKSDIINFV